VLEYKCITLLLFFFAKHSSLTIIYDTLSDSHDSHFNFLLNKTFKMKT
jgi:hypothetical protein